MANNKMSKPKIVIAAIKWEDTIILGPRHWDMTMRRARESLKDSISKYMNPSSLWEEGFIDQFGKFYNRVEAMEIVKENEQLFDYNRNGHQNDKLYSEGIY